MKVLRPMMIGIVCAIISGAVIWGASCNSWQIAGSRDDSGGDHDPAEQSSSTQQSQQRGDAVSRASENETQDDNFAPARRRMVQQDLAARDITDKRILDVMLRIPRHLFVPENARSRAYVDGPLPIGHEQTISQPYIVALMTQLARPSGSSVALDVGTGSGYQAAVLSLLCAEVYSIEIVEPLATAARQRLNDLHYRNVTVRCGDGYRGWPEKAPFDLIIVAAAPDHVPQPLVDQLKPHGRLVIPVGKHYQSLMLIEKKADGTVREQHTVPVAFVPMTGEAQRVDVPRR